MLEREKLCYLCLVEEVIRLLVEHGEIVAEVVCVELFSRVVSLLTLELSQFVDLDLGLWLQFADDAVKETLDVLRILRHEWCEFARRISLVAIQIGLLLALGDDLAEDW